MYNEKTNEIRANNLKTEILSFSDSSNYSALKDRIITRGYGESFHLEKCECNNCTKEQHQLNERVVIKLIKNDLPAISKALKDRKGRGPSFDPKSQVEGKITIQVCIDQDGIVLPERTIFLPNESTIYNETVIEQTIQTANRWKFKPYPVDIACGTVTYVIKLK